MTMEIMKHIKIPHSIKTLSMNVIHLLSYKNVYKIYITPKDKNITNLIRKCRYNNNNTNRKET